MCGICGFTQASQINQSVLKAMCDVITHRGPDGEGQYFDGDIALGHRRLSLIDLEGGNQPMIRASNQHQARITSPALKGDGSPCMSPADARAKGDLAIVFNGEITTTKIFAASLRQMDGSSKQTQTPKSFWWDTLPGEKKFSIAYAACLLLPFGTKRPKSYSAHAISLASNRFTTRNKTERLSSLPK